MAYVVYILQSEASGRFYIGQTKDLGRRLAEHRAGQTRATRGRGPWKVIHQEVYPTRSDAVRKERWLKRQKSHDFVLRYIRER